MGRGGGGGGGGGSGLRPKKAQLIKRFTGGDATGRGHMGTAANHCLF